MERHRREQEQKRRQDALSLQEIKDTLKQLDGRVKQLQEEKQGLFLQLKKVLNDDDLRKKQREAELVMLRQQQVLAAQQRQQAADQQALAARQQQVMGNSTNSQAPPPSNQGPPQSYHSFQQYHSALDPRWSTSSFVNRFKR